jgi:capsule polysaccharide export protein KpsE/RkpR
MIPAMLMPFLTPIRVLTATLIAVLAIALGVQSARLSTTTSKLTTAQQQIGALGQSLKSAQRSVELQNLKIDELVAKGKEQEEALKAAELKANKAQTDAARKVARMTNNPPPKEADKAFDWLAKQGRETAKEW